MKTTLTIHRRDGTLHTVVEIQESELPLSEVQEIIAAIDERTKRVRLLSENISGRTLSPTAQE